MKTNVLKPGLLMAALLVILQGLNAQFDDVYYDPDDFPYSGNAYGSSDPGPSASDPESVVYYDDDTYTYFDDYDYYYTSRIRRFYRPYIGFGFYDPIYVGFNYYDPWAYDYYAYPGASIYLSFGFGFNFFWNNWYYAPGGCYYGYNNWYYPSYTYWNGCGYYGYGYPAYYNPYCAPPGHYGGWGGHHGDYGDYHYGPRTTGNTGTSPRGRWGTPGLVSNPVKERDQDITDANDQPRGLPETGMPGKINPAGQPTDGNPVSTPGSPSVPKTNQPTTGIRQVPVDRELDPGSTPTGPKRPVFRPDAEKYQPYPTPSRPSNTPAPQGQSPETDRPRPLGHPDQSTGGYRPYPQPPRQDDMKPNADTRPVPAQGGARQDDRPRYTPPPRPESRHEERPSYTPPSREHNDRSSDRPSYSPPRQESQRSYDRPSHSAPSSGQNHSSGSGRSSGGSSSSGHSSSPRGRG